MPYDIWRTIVIDTVKLQNGKSLYNFFDDQSEGMEGENIHDIESEKEALRFLFFEKQCSDFILTEFGQGVHHILGMTKRPFVTDERSKPGDIDLLLTPAGNYEETTVIEFKYFKATTRLNLATKVNKANKMIEGIEQVNQYKKFSFYRTFYVIAVFDDARFDDTPNHLLKQTKDKEINKVFYNGFEELESTIGIVGIRLTQLSKKEFSSNFSLSIRTFRQAEKCKQSLGTTVNVVRAIDALESLR